MVKQLAVWHKYLDYQISVLHYTGCDLVWYALLNFFTILKLDYFSVFLNNNFLFSGAGYVKKHSQIAVHWPNTFESIQVKNHMSVSYACWDSVRVEIWIGIWGYMQRPIPCHRDTTHYFLGIPSESCDKKLFET